MGRTESLWPIKSFLFSDGDATIVDESSIIVEYLMRRYPGATRMIPVNDDAALTGCGSWTGSLTLRHESDANAGLGSNASRDRARCQGRRDARRTLDAAYGCSKDGSRLWRGRPVAFSLADCSAAQRFSTRIGCIQ